MRQESDLLSTVFEHVFVIYSTFWLLDLLSYIPSNYLLPRFPLIDISYIIFEGTNKSNHLFHGTNKRLLQMFKAATFQSFFDLYANKIIFFRLSLLWINHKNIDTQSYYSLFQCIHYVLLSIGYSMYQPIQVVWYPKTTYFQRQIQ